MPRPEPVGSIELTLCGAVRRISGGPFDAFAPPAIGVCLEQRSVKADQAAIRIAIADFAPPTPEQFVAGLADILRALRDAPQASLYIGCRAGIGRTGTFMAGLAKLAGITEPIAWLRARYHPEAVETAAQAQAIADLDVAAVFRAV